MHILILIKHNDKCHYDISVLLLYFLNHFYFQSFLSSSQSNAISDFFSFLGFVCVGGGGVGVGCVTP